MVWMSKKIKNYIHKYKIHIYIFMYYVYKGFPSSSTDNLPAMQEIPVQFLGWKDTLEKE